MIRQIKYLSELQLKNLYGLNVFKHTKDKKVKQRTIGLGFAMLLVVLMMVAYIGMAAYGYIMIGMAEVLPAYLIMLSSLVILFFTVFKAGSVIFQRNAYDILCSLPVSQTAIVVSRFIRMYVENLLLTGNRGVWWYGKTEDFLLSDWMCSDDIYSTDSNHHSDLFGRARYCNCLTDEA